MVVSPADIRNQQLQRTTHLNKLVGRGIIEFHWKDEDGKHRVQGDFDFWRRGESISLRISKGSEPLVWVGGDQNIHWMFDMLGDESKLMINQEDVIFSDVIDTLILLGLAPLPEGELSIDRGVVTLIDKADRKWTASFEPSTFRPLEIAIYDEDRHASALHRKGIKVEMLGKNRLVWPETGGLIDLQSTNSNATTKIDFAWISSDTREERMDRVFDLDFLRRALNPQIVEDFTQ
ncbi:MAG: hypothetical protein QGF07_04445 [Phycisphaerales bacterium]|nr:hypothetical protein [Phycisphaerales bacterium]